MIGASGSKFALFLLAPWVDEVADLGALEGVEFRAEADSGVWCETVPDTVRVTEGGMKLPAKMNRRRMRQYKEARLRRRKEGEGSEG